MLTVFEPSCPGEVRIPEYRKRQARVPENRIAQVRAVEISPNESGMFQIRTVEIDPSRIITPEECLALFGEHFPPADVADNVSEYLKLAEQLGRLPIAIAVAAGLLVNDMRYTLPRLLAEAKPHRLAHGELNISALLSTAIASAGDEARQLLSAMAVCAPSGFRLSLTAEIAGMNDESAADALQDLRSRSLVDIVDRESVRCRLHSLIRAEVG